jgi:rhamnogalacturonyl hydrolase YesR
MSGEVRSRAEELLAPVAERTLSWCFGQWYWGDAIAVDGLLAAERGGAVDLTGLVAAAEHWAAHAPDTFDDALAPGAAIAALAADGRLSAAARDRTALAFARLPRTLEGIPLIRPQVPEWRHLVWVDSLYHLPVSVARLGEADDAAAIARATLQVLALPTGIAHIYDAGRRQNNGVAWTRGIGWALLGLLDLAAALPGDDGDPFRAQAARWLDQLQRAQGPDGHWPTVLGDLAARTETSTAAFFVAAALHPQAADAEVDPAALERAIGAVLGCIGADGTVRGVSADTHASWDPAAYRNPVHRPSPWGQGATLRALEAILVDAPDPAPTR